MPTNWPITLGLGQDGPTSLLLMGLAGGAAATISLSRTRTLMPIALSGYAGRDFPDLAADADDVFAIDLGCALDVGDRLIGSSLSLLFYPTVGSVEEIDGFRDGGPQLIGTVAAQAISRPPAARYLLGFTCGTANGRTVAIYSFFNSVGLPDAAN